MAGPQRQSPKVPDIAASQTIEGTDLWESPNLGADEARARVALWTVEWNRARVSLGLMAVAAVLTLVGVVALILLYVPMVTDLLKTAANTPLGSKVIPTFVAAILTGIGLALIAVARYTYDRTVKNFLLQVDMFRREGLATVQAMESMKSITKQR